MTTKTSSSTIKIKRKANAQQHVTQVHFYNSKPRVIIEPPHDDVELPSPPAPPSIAMAPQLITILLPILTAIFYLITLIARGGQGGSPWLNVPIIGVSAISAGVGVLNYVRQRQRREEQAREYERNFTDALAQLRERLADLTRRAREILEANDPELAQLMRIVQGQPDANGIRQPLPTLWQRLREHADFLKLRIGLADLPTTLNIKTPPVNLFQFTPMMQKVLDLANQFRILRQVPLTYSLRDHGSLGVAGPAETTRGFIRALIWQIVVHHSPKDVRIAVFWDSSMDHEWDWLRLLPHTRPFDGDSSYRLLARYDVEPQHLRQVHNALKQELEQRAKNGVQNGPHTVLILNDYHRYGADYGLFKEIIRIGRALGFTVICTVNEAREVPTECGGYVDLNQVPTLAIAGSNGSYTQFTPEAADYQPSKVLARTLHPIVLLDADGRRDLPKIISLLQLYGIVDIREYDPEEYWRDIPQDSWHAAAFGLIDVDRVITLNLNEDGDGIHGVIAAMTGMGKSELTLSLLVSLMMRHSPDRLNLMLIDCKGGTTFSALRDMPHVVGMVTDLEGNMVERALTAIRSELKRREKRLLSAGVPNIRTYRAQGFEQRADFGPMPNMILVIEEYDELQKQHPEHANELTTVAKQGRALGVHLLFTTQQPSMMKEGVRRNLSYALIGKVKDVEDSKVMLGTDAAYNLSEQQKGHVIKGADRRLEWCKVALVTGVYQPLVDEGTGAQLDITGRLLPIRTHEVGAEQLQSKLYLLLKMPQEPFPGTVRNLTEEVIRLYMELERENLLPPSVQYRQDPDTVMQHIAERIEAYLVQARDAQASPTANTRQLMEQLGRDLLDLMQGERTQEQELTLIKRAMLARLSSDYAAQRYRTWMPPLSNDVRLDTLLSHVPADSWMKAVIGMKDLPAEAAQLPLILDLAGHDGNVLVLGSPNTGKKTLLRTLALHLALTHSPADLWLYTIDPGGHGLGLRLPHLASAIASIEAPKVERLLLELQSQIDRRRKLLREFGVDTLLQYRERRKTNQAMPPTPPALLVLIHNIAELAATLPEAIDALKPIIRDGRALGINFAITGYSWRDVSAIQLSFETRIALRLNDPADSDAMIGKSFAHRIKPENRGRAWMRTSDGPIEMQIATPRLRSLDAASGAQPVNNSDFGDIAGDFERAVEAVTKQYQHITDGLPEPLRSLPSRVDLVDLLPQTPVTPDVTIPIAVDNVTLRPITLNLATSTPVLLIAGPPQTGKSELIRTIWTSIVLGYTPEQVQLIGIDYRRRTLQLFEHLPHVPTLDLQVPTPTPTSATKDLRTIRIVKNENELKALIDYLVVELRRRSDLGTSSPRIVLTINDWDLLQGSESTMLSTLAPFMVQGRDLGFHLIVTGTEFGNLNSCNLLKMARLEGCAVHLGLPNEGSSAATNVGIKLPRQLGQIEMVPGRGFIMLQRQLVLGQCAIVSPDMLSQLQVQASS